MHVAIIGGASTIGSTAAFSIAAENPQADISLVDIAEEAAWAHAKDISHATYHFSNSPQRPHIEADSFGTVQGVASDNIDHLDPDLVIVAAGLPQSQREDKDLSSDERREPFAEVLSLVDDLAAQLRRVGPVPVVVVTNPIDRVTYRLWDLLDWPRHRFIGYALSETARVADKIAQLSDVHPNTVDCPTMGEHGEHVVPILSRVQIQNERAPIPEERRTEIVEYVRDIPFEIAEKRGRHDSSRWVTGAGVARLVRTILGGGTDDPFCLATPLSGEYGFEQGCLSVPVTLNGEGVDEILNWDLREQEQEQLETAHDAIWSDLKSL